MKLNAINLAIHKNNKIGYDNKVCCRYPSLLPLKADTVSFSGMKRNAFKDIDRMIIDMPQFKPPLEKFNNSEDFQYWCKTEIDKLLKVDLRGRQRESTIQREETFKEWCDYLLGENGAYTNSIALLVLDGILKGIDKDNDKAIPVLDKRALADTLEKISKSKRDVNFSKEYKTTLQNMSLNDLKTKIDSNKTGWVSVPSRENDPRHFKKNVEKVKTLSCKTWCTASFGAEKYLEKGDFHVYLEKGKPKLGVRFDGDTIVEIQGELNNSKIPIKYLDIAREHTKGNKVSCKVKEEYFLAETVKEKVAEIQKKLNSKGVDIKTCSTKQLFDALNIKYETSGGKLVLNDYRQPNKDFTFEDLGINEDKLFKDISYIKGDIDLRNSYLTNLGSVTGIGGDANFRKSNLESLGLLRTIGGNAVFSDSSIKSLGTLESIGGCAYFRGSKIKDLGKLQTIVGDAIFCDSQITSLGNLRTIWRDVDFQGSKITDLGNLQSVGRDAKFTRSKIKDLGHLRNIGRDVILYDSLLDEDDLKKVVIKGKIIKSLE